MKSRVLGAVCTCIAVLGIPSANASVVINVIESGGNVEASFSGSIDLSATQGFDVQSINTTLYYNAIDGVMLLASENSDAYDVDVTWTPYGTGEGNWDTSTGDAFNLFGFSSIGVPVGYLSGTSISGTATKFGSTLASTGFDPGSYVSTITNGASTDTITVNIGAVPIPAAIWLFGSGLLGLIGIARRRAA
jgi:hypothetical protein